MRAFAPLVALLGIVASLPAFAGPPVCTLDRLGGDQRGPATALVRIGERIFLGTGGAVEIVDVVDPASPLPRGYVDVDTFVTDLAVEGSLAAAVGPNGLSTVDVSDPDHPARLGVLPFASNQWPELALTDGAAYLTPWPGGIAVVDLGDPSAPVLAGVYPLAAADLVVRADRLYAVRFDGVTVLDISDPLAPQHIATATPGGSGIAISGNGERLATWFRCDPRHDCGTVRFYNLADPDLPILRSSVYDGNRTPTAVSMSGGRAYVAYEPGPGDIFDLPNPASPALIGHFEVDWGTALASTAEDLFVSDFYGGLDVHDVVPASGAHRIARYETPDSAVGGFVHAGYAFAVWNDQVRVYDLAAPTGPVQVGRYPAPQGEGFTSASALGGVAYLVTYPAGFRVFDARDPLSPVWGDRFDVGEFQPEMRLAGRRLVASDGVVTLFDLATPTAPLPLGVWDERLISPVELIGYNLFGVEHVEGAPLLGLDFTDPAAPQLLFELPGFGETWGLVATGNGLIAGARTANAALFDAFAPGGPVLVANFPIPLGGSIGGAWNGSQLQLSINGGFATAVHQVWDAGNPAQPVLRLSSPALAYAEETFSGPGVLGLAQGMAGVEFYDSCSPFVDGFESGDTSAWSLLVP